MMHRLQREDSQQRRPRRRQDAAARARALAARASSTGGRDMGPEGIAGARRLPAHRGQRRARGLGALRLRARCPTTAGAFFSRRPRPTARSASATHMGEPAWQEVPGEYRIDAAPHHRHAGRHRAGLGRAAAPARAHLPVALRPAQPVPGQRRGGPSPVGDGLPAARATSAATGARRPRRCSSAARATPTSRASSARSTSRSPTGCRSSCSRIFTDRDGKFQLCALAESGFDPLARTSPLHADRGSAPHVRRRVRRRARHPAHLRGDDASTRPTTRRKCARWASSTCRRSSAT